MIANSKTNDISPGEYLVGEELSPIKEVFLL